MNQAFSQSVWLLFWSAFGLTTLYAQSYDYTLSWENPQTHLYQVQLTTTPQTESYTDFSLPAWRPGRYYLQDYSASISHFSAEGSKGKQLIWTKTNKDTWRVFHPELEKVSISYSYYANNPDAGSSLLTKGQAYFNPVNLFMYIPGRLNDPVYLKIPSLPNDWKIATALTQEEEAKNQFFAATYHDFVDSPTVLSDEIKQLSFELEGTTFYLHFQGDYQGDESVDEALLENVPKICQEQKAIFGSYPFKEYHFIYRLLPYGMRHAVEHSNSASFALPATVTGSPRTLQGLYGITSHEFWHAWNVKRIRPAAMRPYDYSGPQYTQLHWFTEGVTDYYTQLTLVRAGIISEATFLRRMAGTIRSLENSYASQVVSPADASFNSWLARSPYAQPFHRISYYTLGSRMGLILDLALQKRSKGKVTLDDVFVDLYKSYFLNGQGVPENGVQLAAEKLTGTSWQDFFDNYITGTEPIPYSTYFNPVGLELTAEADEKTGAQRIGILRYEDIGQGIIVQDLHPDGDAYQAGIGLEDVIISINGTPISTMEVDRFFNELKEGETLEMEVYQSYKPVTLKFTYKRNFTPQAFDLVPKEKANEAAKSQRSVWLSTKVN
ncbi:MAG: PDZ domain-containing protein [Bacteroidota bacterium]